MAAGEARVRQTMTSRKRDMNSSRPKILEKVLFHYKGWLGSSHRENSRFRGIGGRSRCGPARPPHPPWPADLRLGQPAFQPRPDVPPVPVQRAFRLAEYLGRLLHAQAGEITQHYHHGLERVLPLQLVEGFV